MCGIFAYIGISSIEVGNILLKGLEKLEYRGYDSSGILLGTLLTKAIGSTEELRKKVKLIEVSIGMAHCRWAVCGEVTLENCHPQNSDNIFVVHNGIVENYLQLKENIKDKDYKSQTDTEVIAKLSSTFDSLLESGIYIEKEIKGNNAVVMTNSKEIVAMCNGSPLILGICSNYYLLSSDVNPILDHTNKIVYLLDHDVIHIKDGSYTIYNNGIVNRNITILEDKVDMNSKKNFPHYMLKEIYDQVDSSNLLLQRRVKNNRLEFPELPEMKYNRIVIIGCGTSYYAGCSVRNIMEKLMKMNVTVELASEFIDRDAFIESKDLCIFLSQSGETADTITALKYCKEKGAYTIGLLNVMKSTMGRMVDVAINIEAGQEFSVASTKAYTNQFLLLILIAMHYSTFDKEILRIPSLIEEILKLDVSTVIGDWKDVLLIGKGYSYPICLEGALKMKEVSYVHAEGIAAGELKHGPLALVDNNKTIIVVGDSQNAVSQIQARGVQPLILNKIFSIPKTVPYLEGILYAIILQLMAYKVAIKKGFNVDRPRNLAKSVTTK